MTDDILHRLQLDAAALLSAVPGLAGCTTLVDDTADIEARVIKALGTLTKKGGKCGLACVVMQPEVTGSQKNLPGTVIQIKMDVQVIEQVTINRGTGGTLIRSDAASLRVLGALHMANLGDVLLYSDKDAISPLPAKPGYQSHLVTVHARLDGIPLAAKCGDVAVSRLESHAFVTIDFGSNIPAGKHIGIGNTTYTTSALPTPGTPLFTPTAAGFAAAFTNAGITAVAVGNRVTLTYDTPGTAGNGLIVQTDSADIILSGPAFAGGDSFAITITCATAGAAIHYTTDGTYPSPATTLYTAPLAGVVPGTVFRAAAYHDTMNPGNVLEFVTTA